MRLKKIVVVGLFIVSLAWLFYYMVSVGFLNLDYLGQGQLKSVTIIDSGCNTSICEEEDWTITVTDPDQLNALQNAFFNKFQDISHMTKEDGPMIFIFHYEKKDLELHAGLACDYSGGMIYYTDRQIEYNFNKSELKIFKELYTTSCR